MLCTSAEHHHTIGHFNISQQQQGDEVGEKLPRFFIKMDLLVNPVYSIH